MKKRGLCSLAAVMLAVSMSLTGCSTSRVVKYMAEVIEKVEKEEVEEATEETEKEDIEETKEEATEEAEEETTPDKKDSDKGDSDPEDSSDNSSESEEADDQKEKEAQENTGSQQSLLQTDQATYQKLRTRSAYIDAVARLMYAGEWPDGEETVVTNWEDMDSNQFAIYDLDGDSIEELVISYNPSYMSAKRECVYQYDADQDRLMEELAVFPHVTYYDNGILTAGDARNHTMGPDFWPYTLYQYDSASDQYLDVNTVEAWSKEVSDVYYDGVKFPDEVDADRDGVVYILENYKTDSDVSSKIYLDQDEYEEWFKGVLNGASAMSLPFQTFSNEILIFYTQEYINFLKQRYVESGADTANDMGLVFMDAPLDSNPLQVLEDHLMSQYNLTTVDESSYVSASYQGIETFHFPRMDGDGLNYLNRIDNLTIFGLYPGMPVEEGIARVEAFGFRRFGSSNSSYFTGESFGNYSVSWDVEDGFIQNISIYSGILYLSPDEVELIRQSLRY